MGIINIGYIFYLRVSVSRSLGGFLGSSHSLETLLATSLLRKKLPWLQLGILDEPKEAVVSESKI